MRPIYLSVEGLACFKEKQEIDFSELDLFAISGPTGAGKSTLLDAMLFALYGIIPRVGKQDLKEMISAARDRVSVLFKFDVGDERFRITRTLRRKGSATVRLEKHDGEDFSENVADQVRTAGDEVTRILGLAGDAFTQAVVLPQGQFARFLQAVPRERRGMLRTLLRLEVYERMRDEAQRVSSTKKTARDSAQKLLSNEYDGVTDKALAALEAEWKLVGEKLEELRKERDAAQEQLTKLRALHAKTDELGQKEERLEELNQAAAEIGTAKAELEAAGRAASLVAVLEEATRAADHAKQARAEADQARIDHEGAVKAHSGKEELLQKANAAAAEVAPTREKVARLNQILGRLPERNRLAETIERQRTDVDTMKAKVAGLRQDLDGLSETQRAQLTTTEAARTTLEGISYDADLDVSLAKVRDLAAKLSVAREGLKTATDEKAKRQKAMAELTGRIEFLEREAKGASQVEAEAQKAADAADQAVHDAHRMDEANHLRESLAAGESCPVCDQVVKDPPPADLRPEVEKAKTTREETAFKLKNAQKKAREKHEVLTREQGNADAAQRARDEANAAHKNALEAVAGQEVDIRTRLDGRGPKGDQGIEVWVEEHVRASSNARKAYEAAKQKLEQAERNLTKAKETEKATKEKIDETNMALRKLEGELKDNERCLEALQKKISEVTRSPDPEAERDGLVGKITDLESEQKCAAEAVANTKNQLTAAEQALKLKTKAAKEAEEGAVQRQKTRDERVALAGFQNARAIEEAVRNDEVQADLREKVQAHERELHTVEQRINTLKKELGTERVSKDQLENASKRATDLSEEVETVVGRGKKLEHQVESMKQRLKRSKELREELQAEEEGYRLYNHLAADLRSDKFQAYVLEEAFTELVRGASTRLLALTRERYSLEFAEDQIVVVDHDNAGETRISDTLSGGETFLTSLSLALELSEQVQRAAGAVNLDSLFIDEGFGTLDPDTLAVVSETIQSLQVGGRMVGIITHIPELRDEFSQQILVTKHEGYSTVEVRPRST